MDSPIESRSETTSGAAPARRSRRLLWLAVTLAGLSAALALAAWSTRTVTVTGPRVHIQWAATLSADDRQAAEQRHDLRNPRPFDQSAVVWRYELGDWSPAAVAALVNDPAVADSHYINKSTYAVDEPTTTVRWNIPSLRSLVPFPFSTDNRFESLWFFVHVQSLALIAAGYLLLRAARSQDAHRRRTIALAVIIAAGIGAYALRFPPSLLRMADSSMYTRDRDNFERAVLSEGLKFESHLTQAILARTYPAFGPGEDAPERTFVMLTRLATAWFFLCALAIGFVERWSAQVVRYLALVILAPSTLMYFGHRDFAYLALNVAAFPLLAHGIAQGSKRLEAGSALAGLGAALHGFGLLSMAGAWLATLAARASLLARAERLLRIAAWATAAWVGWLAIYFIVLNLPIAAGRAGSGSWRPLFVDDAGSRLNVAIFSAAGVRDVLVEAWVVGVPLLVVAASLWRRYRDQVLMVLCYAIPSALFLTFYWPVQGLGVDTGHVVAAFPAFYAAAWLCAREPRHTMIAAALLVSAHLGFWRMVLDTRFVNWRLFS